MTNHEIEDSTVTFYTWVETMSDQPLIDIGTANFLKDSISGYMTSPVGVYNGKPITAKTRRADSILKVKETFNKLNKENPVFLYMVMYQPAGMVYVMSEAFWLIRYATLNEEFS